MDHQKLNLLKLQKPTNSWLKMVDEFYDKYQSELIQKTNDYLDKFIDHLKFHNTAITKEKVKDEVKELVLSLNKLNEIQSNYIATGEREDLCEFIDSCIIASGIDLEDYEDLTFEWREW